MVLNREEELGGDVYVDRMRLEQLKKFKYLVYVLNESGTYEAGCRRKVSSRRVSRAIRRLVNARGLQLECARVLHEILLVSVLMYGSDIMIWKEKERSRVKAVPMDNLRYLLGIRNKLPNARMRELCGVTKGMDKIIDEGVLRWFGHVQRMERDRIPKRVYVGDCVGSRSMGRSRKRWIDTVKGGLKKRGLDVKQARRMAGVC